MISYGKFALGELPENAILCTVDVVGLYPNIPNDEGLRVLFDALEKREDKAISTTTLFELANLVLKNNYFEFNGEVFHQKRGLPLGRKWHLHMLFCLWMIWKGDF